MKSINKYSNYPSGCGNVPPEIFIFFQRFCVSKTRHWLQTILTILEQLFHQLFFQFGSACPFHDELWSARLLKIIKLVN